MSSRITWSRLAIYGFGLIFVGWLARVIVHEFGHALALLAMGEDVGIWMRIELYSGFVSWHHWNNETLDLWQRVIVTLSGTFAVVLVAYLLVLSEPRDKSLRLFLRTVAFLWVASEFINMTPIRETDGKYLSTIWGEHVQYSILAALAIFAAYLLFVLSQRPAAVKVTFS